MKKGQFSFDFIAALLAAIVLFSGITLLNSNLQNDSQKSAESNSAKAVLMDVYSAIGSAKAYGVTIEYATPKMKSFAPENPANCTIEISSSEIKVVAGNSTQSYEGLSLSDVKINGVSLGGTANSFTCGTALTISGA